MVRNGLSHDLADLLLADLRRLLPLLDKQHQPRHDADDAGDFAHGAETTNPRSSGRH